MLYSRMNGIVAKPWLWRSEEDFWTESLLSQSFSFKTYKIYITVISTHLL